MWHRDLRRRHTGVSDELTVLRALDRVADRARRPLRLDAEHLEHFPRQKLGAAATDAGAEALALQVLQRFDARVCTHHELQRDDVMHIEHGEVFHGLVLEGPGSAERLDARIGHDQAEIDLFPRHAADVVDAGAGLDHRDVGVGHGILDGLRHRDGQGIVARCRVRRPEGDRTFLGLSAGWRDNKRSHHCERQCASNARPDTSHPISSTLFLAWRGRH